MSRISRGSLRSVGLIVAFVIGLGFLQPHSALAATTISVMPSSGIVGDPISVTGAGFQNGEVVTISLSGFGTVATTTAMGVSGSIAASFSIPGVVPGSHTVTAHGQSSLSVAQTTLQVIGGPGTGLTVQKSVSIDNGVYGAGGNANPGQSLTYALQYSNTGAVPATSVVITDTLAAGQQLIALSPGCTQLNNAGVVTVTCTVASVPPAPSVGFSGSFFIGTRIVPGFAGTIVNTASISAANAAQTNSNTTTVNVGFNPAGGNLQKFVSVNGNGYGQSFNANPGDTLVYDIEYTNPVGSPTAVNVTIYDTLQPGQTLLAFAGGSVYCNTFVAGTNTVACPVGSVPPGQTVRVHIATTINQLFSGQITNQATESSNGVPTLTSNTTLIQVGTGGTVFGTNFTLCGLVSSFTGTSITVSGVTLPLTFGATGIGTPVVGTNECISFVFNSVGQVTSLVVSSNLAGLGVICGVYTATGAAGSIQVGGITVATSFTSNLQFFLVPGTFYCFLITPNGVAYAVLTGTPTAATVIGHGGGYGPIGSREMPV